MATITMISIIKEMMDNNGSYQGDPQVLVIIEYTGMDGNTQWAVAEERREALEIWTSPYVTDPVVIWSRPKGKVQDPTEPGKVRIIPAPFQPLAPEDAQN